MRVTVVIVLLFSLSLKAQVCKNWGKPIEIGSLDFKLIEEASGIIKSDKPNRLYHVNDSGDGPFFYQTQLDGSETKKIEVKNFKPDDVESMTYGSCGSKNCLVIADIGDNDEHRETISFVIIEEEENFPKKVFPYNIITAVYPDKAHNVEGVAMHPNGNIYILTKAIDYDNNRAAPAQVYLLEKQQWQTKSAETVKLKHLGQIDLPYHLYLYNLFGRIVTGFDIHPNGDKLLISTYKAVVEIELDLSSNIIQNTRMLEPGNNMVITPLKALPQIESITYLDDKNILYTTEYHKEFGAPPLVKMECLD